MDITTAELIKLYLIGFGLILIFSDMYWRFPSGFTIILGKEKRLTRGEQLRFAYQFPIWKPIINIRIYSE